jgi:hypothetical protein
MAGERLVRWNLEHGKPVRWQPLDLMRIGWAAFYGGGMAWFPDEDRTLADARHEFGVGLRFGPTRSGSGEMGRIDLTWDLDTGGPHITSIARGYF